MNSESQEQEAAARLGRLLADLPARPAPATLEARVRRELERRLAPAAEKLGQRRGFRHWPGWGRAGFVTLSAALVCYSALDLPWRLAAGPIQAASELAAGWLQPAVALAALAGVLTHGLMRWLPPAWLAGFAAMVMALYAVLFALGTAAYRTLYVHSSRLGDSA